MLRLLLASRYNDTITLNWQTVDLPARIQQVLPTPFAPLFYQLLCTHYPVAFLKTVPHWLALHQRYVQTGLVNSFLLELLHQIVPAFQQAHIPLILLKGSAFASDLYGDIALRPMADLDLLIPFQQYPQAVALLQKLNFAPPTPFPFHNRAGWYWNECALVRPGTPPLTVELHWQLLDIPFYAQQLPESLLRQRAVEVMIAGVPALSLAPDDHLLHLCAHNLYHHAGQHPFVALDIAHLLQKYGTTLHWERFLETARTARLGLAIKQTLMPALIEWHIPLPDFLQQEINRLPIHPVEHLWATAQRHESLKLIRTWLTLPSFSLQLHFAWGQLFPTSEYLAWRYNSSPMRATFQRFRNGICHLFSFFHPPNWGRNQTK